MSLALATGASRDGLPSGLQLTARNSAERAPGHMFLPDRVSLGHEARGAVLAYTATCPGRQTAPQQGHAFQGPCRGARTRAHAGITHALMSTHPTRARRGVSHWTSKAKPPLRVGQSERRKGGEKEAAGWEEDPRREVSGQPGPCAALETEQSRVTSWRRAECSWTLGTWLPRKFGFGRLPVHPGSGGRRTPGPCSHQDSSSCLSVPSRGPGTLSVGRPV